MLAENKMWRGASGAPLRHQLTIFSVDIFCEEIARIFWRLVVREHLRLCLSFVVMMPLNIDHLQKKNVHLTRDKLKGMILIIWKTYGLASLLEASSKWWSFAKIIVAPEHPLWKVEHCETTIWYWSRSVVAILLLKRTPNSKTSNQAQYSQRTRCLVVL